MTETEWQVNWADGGRQHTQLFTDRTNALWAFESLTALNAVLPRTFRNVTFSQRTAAQDAGPWEPVQ